MNYLLKSALALFVVTSVTAQNNTTYWQQKVDYKMEIDMDAKTGQYKGKQALTYTNNSPDALNKVFYHLYFNAFQPGSEMDVRSLNIADPDPRVGERISKLSPSEIGYIKPLKLTQDGIDVAHEVVGTVLEVTLNKPILPGQSSTFHMLWDAQVPIQVRRSGRDSKDGISLSMTQWYPKLAEYDFQGWHADPYIGREFHGVWGDFNVSISLDKDYIVAATGYLEGEPKVKRGKKTWVFDAPMVHDFTWAADPDYVHDKVEGPNGVTLNFYYQDNPAYAENWKKIQSKTAELMVFFNENIGEYPYKQYSVIQGGDGGMEYAMCTLIAGGEKYEGLLGTTSHEMAHSWFQFLLATNEAKHEWMDEGFTSYISGRAMNKILDRKRANPAAGSYRGYNFLAKSGKEQPLTTHADRYETNRSYGIAAYSKGAVFMAQLAYVIGEENLANSIKRYYEEWKFKHPTPNDFIRVAEKVSGLELDWYLMDFGQTTNTIDYGIKSFSSEGNTAKITLERIGLMPMPIDLLVTFEDGSTSMYNIPLQMMRGEKPGDYKKAAIDWAWAYPTYDLILNEGKPVKSVEIDPSGLMADINRENNTASN